MDEQITMNLNGNKLVLNPKTGWRVQSEDFQHALLEINKLVEEKEVLGKSLEVALHQIEALTEEIKDVNKAKKVVLEMLMNERQQRIALERQIEGYEEELRESFRTIVQLRKIATDAATAREDDGEQREEDE